VHPTSNFSVLPSEIGILHRPGVARRTGARRIQPLAGLLCRYRTQAGAPAGSTRRTRGRRWPGRARLLRRRGPLAGEGSAYKPHESIGDLAAISVACGWFMPAPRLLPSLVTASLPERPSMPAPTRRARRAWRGPPAPGVASRPTCPWRITILPNWDGEVQSL
jgi:hypothetical protein